MKKLRVVVPAELRTRTPRGLFEALKYAPMRDRRGITDYWLLGEAPLQGGKKQVTLMVRYD